MPVQNRIALQNENSAIHESVEDDLELALMSLIGDDSSSLVPEARIDIDGFSADESDEEIPVTDHVFSEAAFLELIGKELETDR